MRAQRTFVIATLITVAACTFTRAAERVDLLLVLAADISRSMDEAKFQLQRSGYVAAFSDPQVIEAIRAGPTGRIAVTFIEWSGPLSQQIVVDWTLISNDRTAHQFGDRVVEAPRAFADSTSISAGIAFAMTQLDRAPYETQRRVIDVSGDGDNNGGSPVAAARDNAVAKGVTINGLAILTKPLSPSYSNHTNPPGGLANYYHDNVIGGPSAFVMVAEDSNSFGSALIKKLTAELAQIRSRKPIWLCDRAVSTRRPLFARFEVANMSDSIVRMWPRNGCHQQLSGVGVPLASPHFGCGYRFIGAVEINRTPVNDKNRPND